MTERIGTVRSQLMDSSEAVYKRLRIDINGGQVYYKKRLQQTIEGQERARELLERDSESSNVHWDWAFALAEFPRTPSWIWCLTARVVDENVLGEDKRPVRGSRHFAPGTKVYLACPHWGGRVAAIGVPRYADKRIRVVMSLSKLESFALEKVCDPEVILALQHPYQTWPYTSMAPSELGGIPWDESDESRELIEKLAERLNGERTMA